MDVIGPEECLEGDPLGGAMTPPLLAGVAGDEPNEDGVLGEIVVGDCCKPDGLSTAQRSVETRVTDKESGKNAPTKLAVWLGVGVGRSSGVKCCTRPTPERGSGRPLVSPTPLFSDGASELCWLCGDGGTTVTWGETDDLSDAVLGVERPFSPTVACAGVTSTLGMSWCPLWDSDVAVDGRELVVNTLLVADPGSVTARSRILRSEDDADTELFRDLVSLDRNPGAIDCNECKSKNVRR